MDVRDDFFPDIGLQGFAPKARLKAPNTKDEGFEDMVKSAQGAVVLVLVY